MADDLDRITSGLRADPRDPLAVQALADWLEERGAKADSVRALAVDGPTVLVLGIGDDDLSEDYVNGVHKRWNEVCQWLANQTGSPIHSVVVPSAWTIRAIKANLGGKP